MPEYTAQGPQVSAKGPEAGDPSYVGELTVIWDYEKAELHRRLDDLENYLRDFEHKAKQSVLARLDALESRVFNLTPPSDK